MARKPLLATVRDALSTASQLLSSHSDSGRGEIGKAENKIRDAKTEIDKYVGKNGEEYYEDVRW